MCQMSSSGTVPLPPGADGPTPGGKGTVPDEDIWHIVNYVLSLPYDFDGELGADRTMASKDRF